MSEVMWQEINKADKIAENTSYGYMSLTNLEPAI